MSDAAPERASSANRWLPLLPIGAVAIACAPLVLHGFPKGHDWSLELVRIAQFAGALADGPRPPAWAGDVYGGFGAPVFLYYPPLFSAASVALSPLAGSLWAGAVAALAMFAVVGAVATYRLVRVFAEPAAARVAVYAFALNPYLLCDAYRRNADAEFAALCLAPIALLGAARLEAWPRRGAALVAAGLALAILAHNQTALMVLALTGVAVAVLYGPRPRGAEAAGAAGGVVLGLALASFFWVPALVQQPLMRPEEVLTGKFDFHAQFASLFDAFGYVRFYATGLLVPTVAIVALVAARIAPTPRMRRLLIACAAGVGVFAFLATSASAFVWERAPLLPLFQFPWRMLGPAGLVASLAAGLAFESLGAGRSARVLVAAEVAIFALFAANAAPVLGAAKPLDPGPRARLAHRLAPDTVRSQELGVTVGDEYLPRGADPSVWRDARYVARPVLRAEPAARTRVERDRPTDIAFSVEAESPTRIALGRFSYPGWRATVDGSEAALESGPDGTLEMTLPAGTSQVEVRFVGPGVRRVFSVASLGALAVWLALAWRRPRDTAHST